MRKRKGYVRNKARPEGSIAEGYLANECLMFGYRYLYGVETKFNKRERNYDGGQPSCDSSQLPIFSTPCQFYGKETMKNLNMKVHNIAAFYFLQNCENC